LLFTLTIQISVLIRITQIIYGSIQWLTYVNTLKSHSDKHLHHFYKINFHDVTKRYIPAQQYITIKLRQLRQQLHFISRIIDTRLDQF
jgi:hypothetical protein